MQVLELETTNKLLFPKGSVLTLGNFDGLHRGHLALIQKVNEIKEQFQLPSILVTYHPNPAIIIGKNQNLKNIYSEEQKKDIVSKYGIDFYLSIPFTYEFSLLSAFDFVHDILIQKLNARYIIIGYNHYFGKDKEGDYEYLVKLSEKFGYEVEKIDPVYLGNEKISSSLIRFFLQNGEIEKANEMLGRNFSVVGEVVHGEARGRKIQFPTANLLLEENRIYPKRGVYIGLAKLENASYRSMINIGFKPTFNGRTLSVESHLLEFEGDLYGKRLELIFLKKIRDEKKFQNVDELVQQLNADKKTTIEFFKKVNTFDLDL